MEALAAIAARRSIGRLLPPGPSGPQLDRILVAATSAPDHEELRPWRFVVLAGEAKDAFGQVLADAYVARSHRAGIEPTPGQAAKERAKLDRAPTVVVVAAEPQESAKVPFVEQLAATAAAAYAALLAATALGLGSMWRTGPAAYDPAVRSALGLSPDAAVVGFLYLGTAPDGSVPGPRRPDVEGLVRHWRPPSGAPGAPMPPPDLPAPV